MDNRKETAEKIITALTNRSGFNDLWYNLDEEIQTEITDEIVNILPINGVSTRFLVANITISDIVKGRKYELIETESMGYYIIDDTGEEHYYNHSVLDVC